MMRRDAILVVAFRKREHQPAGGHNRQMGGLFHPRFCPVAAHFGGDRRSRGREDGCAVKLHLGAFETPCRWQTDSSVPTGRETCIGVLPRSKRGSTPPISRFPRTLREQDFEGASPLLRSYWPLCRVD